MFQFVNLIEAIDSSKSCHSKVAKQTNKSSMLNSRLRFGFVVLFQNVYGELHLN